MSITRIAHEFVDAVPRDPQPGILYVSLRHRTAVHMCPCGCGNKVVTPIKPPQWHLCYDGESVSLSPSIGSWQFPCRSHYWITNGEVRWARAWTNKEIEAGRQADALAIRQHYTRRSGERSPAQRHGRPPLLHNLLIRAWRWLSRRD